MIGGLVSAIMGTGIQVVSTLSYSGMGMRPVDFLFGCLGCLTWLASGLIAVWHYTNKYQLTLTSRQGFKLGALAGLVNALAIFLFGRALVFMGIMPSAADMARLFTGNPAFGVPDTDMDMYGEVFGFAFVWGALLFGLVLGPLLGLIGGAIGSAMFERGRRDVVIADLSDD